MINSLEDKVLGLTEKVGKLSSLVMTDRKTKIRMSALKETRNKFRYNSVWASGRKIMYKGEGDTKAKAHYD